MLQTHHRSVARRTMFSGVDSAVSMTLPHWVELAEVQ
jgi:hypothetical protein